jgi:hypothetical protein
MDPAGRGDSRDLPAESARTAELDRARAAVPSAWVRSARRGRSASTFVGSLSGWLAEEDGR